MGYVGCWQHPSCSLLGGPHRLQLWPSLLTGTCRGEDGDGSTLRQASAWGCSRSGSLLCHGAALPLDALFCPSSCISPACGPTHRVVLLQRWSVLPQWQIPERVRSQSSGCWCRPWPSGAVCWALPCSELGSVLPVPPRAACPRAACPMPAALQHPLLQFGCAASKNRFLRSSAADSWHTQ